MANLNINYAEASKTGRDIQALATEINNILKRVSAEMEDVQQSWQGTKATNFKNEFDTLKANFDKVFNAINSMGAAINASAMMYDEDGSTTTPSA